MKTLGMLMWVGAGLLLWFIMLGVLHEWWGVGGVIAGFIFAPGVVLFPLLYWFMESVFPVWYFIFWGIGLVGLFISSITFKSSTSMEESIPEKRGDEKMADKYKKYCGQCGENHPRTAKFCPSCGKPIPF